MIVSSNKRNISPLAISFWGFILTARKKIDCGTLLIYFVKLKI